jgi:endoribonuclease LACTB2
MFARPERLGTGMERFALRTPTLPPATTTNSYALGEREVLLVEPATPFDDERRAFIAWANGLEASGRELVALFVTHHHPDHVGGAAFLARELSLPLWGHAETALRLPELSFARTLDEGHALVLDGPEPQRWHCLWTPGHAPGHLCLHEPEARVLIAGDMVASEGTIVIAPDDGDLALYLGQLERLAALGAELALPAHGEPIRSPLALFQGYLAHRRLREERVVTALAVGPSTLDELVARAYADTDTTLWPLAKLSLESHLVKLVREGRAVRDEARWRLE